MRGEKGYKREHLLDRAIELFRKQGYSATSTAELVDDLGVNRKSMYAEFGSKQGLFEAALERYSNVHLSSVLSRIESPDANATSIREAFHGYASASESKFNGLGCLMANTAVERAALDPGAAKFVDAYLARLRTAFRNAVENAYRDGDLGDDVDRDDLAALLAMSVVGISALIRAKAPPAQIYAASRAITKVFLASPA